MDFEFACQIPYAKNDFSIIRTVFNFINDFLKLIDTFTGIIRITINVFRTKVSPLKSINRS